MSLVSHTNVFGHFLGFWPLRRFMPFQLGEPALPPRHRLSVDSDNPEAAHGLALIDLVMVAMDDRRHPHGLGQLAQCPEAVPMRLRRQTGRASGRDRGGQYV